MAQITFCAHPCHGMKCNLFKSRLRECRGKTVHPPAGAQCGPNFTSRKISVRGTQKRKRESPTRSGKGVKFTFKKFPRGFAPDPVSPPFPLLLSSSSLSSSPHHHFFVPLSHTLPAPIHITNQQQLFKRLHFIP